MILAIIGAGVIGLSLGLMGSGGSILTVPVLVYLLGQEEKLAIAGSLLIVGTIAFVGAIPYVMRKLVDWQNVCWFGIPGMVGTYIGAYLSQFIPGIAQLTLFAMLMLFAAYKMFKQPNAIENAVTQRTVINISIDGLVVGVVTGIVGVGGGFLIVPALVLMGGLSMRRAVATSLVIIALKSYSGFYKYWELLKEQGYSFDWSTLLTVAGIGILGAFAGNQISEKLPQQQLKHFFGLFLIGMSAFILFKTAPRFL